jgi:hypothetical protein
LLSPELFYTGITRASKHCTLLIQEDIGPLLNMRRREISHLVCINSSIFVFSSISYPSQTTVCSLTQRAVAGGAAISYFLTPDVAEGLDGSIAATHYWDSSQHGVLRLAARYAASLYVGPMLFDA